jgi:hypothetical protein
MDNMLEENKNLKDTSKSPLKDSSSSVSLAPLWRDHSSYYNKTNKLITALYMVTDTMEKEEPLRLKLRTLGVEILSDIASLSKGTFSNLNEKITTILSFLNIASDIRMISEMNCNILRKEFTELKQSIQEFTTGNNLWLEEFIQTPSKEELNPYGTSPLPRGRSKEGVLSFKNDKENSKGQTTRIGVQKGSTLMKALSGIKSIRQSVSGDTFELIKQQRRESILKTIKDKPNGVSIKDIILAIRSLGDNTGEKTLQRELVSMLKDNVLKKTGEKRWSLYFLN